MLQNGKVYSTPKGRVWLNEDINVVKFLTKEEFDKMSQGMMSKYVVHLCTTDKISNKKIDLYFITKK